MSRLTDYSKWDNIELSDDSEDDHPNIDRASFIRMKHRARVEREVGMVLFALVTTLAELHMAAYTIQCWVRDKQQNQRQRRFTNSAPVSDE